jgi:hypothetical protein
MLMKSLPPSVHSNLLEQYGSKNPRPAPNGQPQLSPWLLAGAVLVGIALAVVVALLGRQR